MRSPIRITSNTGSNNLILDLSIYHRNSEHRRSFIPVLFLDLQKSGTSAADTIAQKIYFRDDSYRHSKVYDDSTNAFRYEGSSLKKRRLQNKDYLVGKGIISEYISHEVFNIGGGKSRYTLIQKPLLVLGVERPNIEYVLACYRINKAPEPDAFKLLMDPKFDSPSTLWKGGRFLYRKHLRDSLAEIPIETSNELDFLFGKPQVPKFESMLHKEATIQNIGNTISIQLLRNL